MNSTDKIFYIMGLILFGGVIVIGVLQATDVLILTNLAIPCSFRFATGFYCPGCGGTHAICALARGNFIECFQNHPFVFYTAICFIIYLVWNTIAVFAGKIKKKNAGSKEIPVMHFRTVYVYIGLAVLLIQWIVKNVLAYYAR